MGEVFVRSEDKNNDFVRWEKFLPKLVLRILLVEADDSTRQIITALLRKCSYKVAAVSDGLKAWEVLKGRSHDIDLILTEVELPSISGFALLTLIMEHQVCKNIPVIMMSAHDSVSTVYKCMLKGAADFLVKPVRKNELKNLWQHVWRRQSSTTGEINALQKVEATAENNSTSSGYMACIEIGSDTQSSCTKPDMESDEPQPMRSEQLGTEPEGHMSKADTSGQMVTEAIDLIGSFDSYPKTSYSSLLNYGTNDPSPILDLSLRRSHPSIISDRLKQSDVSAFSRYINKTQVSNTNQQKEYEISSDRQLSVGYISDTHSSPKERVFPVPVPAFCVQPQKMQSPCCSGQPNYQTNAYYIPNPETSPETEALEDHSATSSLCNGETLACLNNGNRSTQREAALNKFRLKRKDRCFDKKVRYESRKKLAEQRPRVKGQFVRRGQTNNPSSLL